MTIEYLMYGVIFISTLFSSVFHGSNFFSKGLVILFQQSCFLLSFYYLTGGELLLSCISFAPSLIYWTVMRTSEQAISELDVITNPSFSNILEVNKSYLPTFILTFFSIFYGSILIGYADLSQMILMIVSYILGSLILINLTLLTFNKKTKIGRYLHNELHETWEENGNGDGAIDNRRMQEIFIGLFTSASICVICYNIIGIFIK